MPKARWKIEQDHRQLKEELGLDHYKCGRLAGLPYHVTLVMFAQGFSRLATLRNKNSISLVPARAGLRLKTCYSRGQKRRRFAPASLDPRHQALSHLAYQYEATACLEGAEEPRMELPKADRTSIGTQ